MNKEFLQYTEALALKELGFDEECIATFTDSKLMVHGKESLDSIKGSGLHNRHLGTSGRIITAPLFQQCWRWFREKYQISPTIHCMSEQGNSWKYHIPNEGGEKDFLTYEEAELECLKQLIKIVKDERIHNL
jgi:hypothetical protein